MAEKGSTLSKCLNRSLLSTIILAFSLLSAPGAGAVRSAGVGQKERKPITVAIVLWDGVQIIDYSGPWEVFGQAGFKVFTVADKSDPITTRFDQKVTPDYTFDNSPQADIVLLPGGGGTQKTADNPRAIKWIQEQAKNARYVMSVCTGAFLLARTGLLDGLTATTFHNAIDRLSKAAPNTRVIYDQRYVDNGKVITTAGLSSGIDGALHVVEKILGKGPAQSEALGLEYNWQGDSTPARAAFADRYLPDFQGFEAKMISVNGDLNHWDMQVLVSKPSSAAEIMDIARKQIVSATPHTSSQVVLNSRGSRSGDRSELEWKFKDDLGRPWVGFAAVAPANDESNKFNMTVKLTREKK
jgi:putative intracellular protease/amidase